MPEIRFIKNYPSLTVPEGKILMQALLDAGMPVASSCHGDAVCGKCKIEILAGKENLSPIESGEEILRRRLRIRDPYRISCQSRVLGDITVDATYW